MNCLSPALSELAKTSRRRPFPKNALIIQEGDQTDSIYILLSGRVRAFTLGADGRELVYGEYQAGELFGEMSLDGGPRSASVMAMELSECAVISRNELEAFLKQHPELAMELIAKVISRARQATMAAKNLALLDVYGRLKAYFETAPAVQDGPRRILTHRLTHADLAKHLGASREMISKLLKDLESGGYVQVINKEWVVASLPSRW